MSRTLYSFLHKLALLYEQWTSHALIKLIEYMKMSIHQGDRVGILFINLRKAFDTVDHKILMEKHELFWCLRYF